VESWPGMAWNLQGLAMEAQGGKDGAAKDRPLMEAVSPFCVPRRAKQRCFARSFQRWIYSGPEDRKAVPPASDLDPRVRCTIEVIHDVLEPNEARGILALRI
jgi:hypothetical protein